MFNIKNKKNYPRVEIKIDNPQQKKGKRNVNIFNSLTQRVMILKSNEYSVDDH